MHLGPDTISQERGCVNHLGNVEGRSKESEGIPDQGDFFEEEQSGRGVH